LKISLAVYFQLKTIGRRNIMKQGKGFKQWSLLPHLTLELLRAVHSEKWLRKSAQVAALIRSMIY